MEFNGSQSAFCPGRQQRRKIISYFNRSKPLSLSIIKIIHNFNRKNSYYSLFDKYFLSIYRHKMAALVPRHLIQVNKTMDLVGHVFRLDHFRLEGMC